ITRECWQQGQSAGGVLQSRERARTPHRGKDIFCGSLAVLLPMLTVRIAALLSGNEAAVLILVVPGEAGPGSACSFRPRHAFGVTCQRSRNETDRQSLVCRPRPVLGNAHGQGRLGQPPLRRLSALVEYLRPSQIRYDR